MSSAKRKPRLPVLVRPKPLGKGDEFSDRVTLGTTTHIVEAYVFARAGEKPEDNPEISVIMSGRAPKRQPFDFYNPPSPKNIIELNPGIKLAPPGQKWCSVKDHWVDKSGFTKKDDAFDGLHPYCQDCRNAYKRQMYWLKKEAATSMPMAA
jgi:hypothetical protein